TAAVAGAVPGRVIAVGVWRRAVLRRPGGEPAGEVVGVAAAGGLRCRAGHLLAGHVAVGIETVSGVLQDLAGRILDRDVLGAPAIVVLVGGRRPAGQRDGSEFAGGGIVVVGAGGAGQRVLGRGQLAIGVVVVSGRLCGDTVLT